MTFFAVVVEPAAVDLYHRCRHHPTGMAVQSSGHKLRACGIRHRSDFYAGACGTSSLGSVAPAPRGSRSRRDGSADFRLSLYFHEITTDQPASHDHRIGRAHCAKKAGVDAAYSLPIRLAGEIDASAQYVLDLATK